MTKEEMMEDLIKRSGSYAAMKFPATAKGEDQTWQATNGFNVPSYLEPSAGTWQYFFLLALISGIGILGLCGCVCCLFTFTSKKEKKKKKSFGDDKKLSYLRDQMMRVRNPTPVTNPDRGNHYLKKSPSPLDSKPFPGMQVEGTITMTHPDGYMRKNAIQLCGQQVSGQDGRESSSSSSNHVYGSDLPDVGQMGDDAKASCSKTSLDLNGGELGQLGTLHCTMKYSFDKNALIVTVNKCTKLPAKDLDAKSSDPYVKLQLLPEKQHKVKTRVMRRTLNPVYDEDFTFYGINFKQLPRLTLHFVVLSFDRYSRDDIIGEVMLELEKLDLSSSDSSPVPICKEITPKSFKLKSQGRGEVLVSLCYQPAANRITVVVLKARNLPKMDITGLSDPYIKIYLLYNDQRIAKKKTHVKKRTLNPVFNESFVFELPHLEEGLKNISLEFSLLDWDRVTKNEVIGRLDLGGEKCSGTALNHWNEVVSSPRRQIAEWHKLKA